MGHALESEMLEKYIFSPIEFMVDVWKVPNLSLENENKSNELIAVETEEELEKMKEIFSLLFGTRSNFESAWERYINNKKIDFLLDEYEENYL